MNIGTKRILIWTLVAAMAAGSTLPVSAAGTKETHADTISWNALTFSASKWLNEIATRIEIRSVDAAEAATAAVVSDQGEPIAASGPTLRRIEISTTIAPAIGATVQLNKKFWFDSGRRSILFGESQRTGQEEYLRRFRFTRQGIYRYHREPANSGEAPQSPGQWSDTKASFYAFNTEKWACRSVLEPSILIYLISQADFKSADSSMTFCVFHKRHLFRVSVRNSGVQDIEMKYTEIQGGTPIGRSETVQALKLVMTAEPLGGYRGEVQDFSFLGFKENIELYFDPASRLPLMISGKIPTVGQAMLKLTRVRYSNDD